MEYVSLLANEEKSPSSYEKTGHIHEFQKVNRWKCSIEEVILKSSFWKQRFSSLHQLKKFRRHNEQRSLLSFANVSFDKHSALFGVFTMADWEHYRIWSKFEKFGDYYNGKGIIEFIMLDVWMTDFGFWHM